MISSLPLICLKNPFLNIIPGNHQKLVDLLANVVVLTQDAVDNEYKFVIDAKQFFKNYSSDVNSEAEDARECKRAQS